MLLSMNWIGDFVDLSGLDKKALIHRFTLSTAEVEDVIEMGADTYGVIVAEIASIEDHPNSKKLHLLKINTGSGDLVDCVCGAPNVRVGMRVAFATEGGSVAGHPITAATVAGFPSFGMCCSESELGISADHSGLMEITEDVALGTDIKAVYPIDDIIFEVDNKSLTNRPDLWGHYGIAREFATLSGRPLKALPTHDTSVYASLPALSIKIDEPSLCYRYSGITVENVKEKVSPITMRIRLFYCGSRAINLLADLTNYVMMELGQPMHAFDRRRVDAIEVRRLDEASSFKTLDGVERRVDENTLMICSHGKPVAIAGIMGGLDSEIEDDTDTLLLESASFDAVSVRKSSTRLGLRTDASMRYEKTLDPEMTKIASERFLSLLLAIDGGVKVTSSLTDVYPTHYDTITLEIDKAYVDRYTGIDISLSEIETTLTALGFGIEKKGETLSVTVPSFRATKDVTIKADLIEEITRIYGYDNFKITTTLSPLAPVRTEMAKSDENRVKDLLVNEFALHEVHSYIWSDSAKDKLLGIETPKNVSLLNAQTPEHTSFRISMIPTLLAFAYENRGFDESYGLFEIGHTVEGLDENNLCREIKKLGVVLYDRTKTEEELYYDAHDMICEIAESIKRIDPRFASIEPRFDWQHPVNTAKISLGDVEIGFLATLHPAVRANLDRKAAIVCFEIDMQAFSAKDPESVSYREPSKFPGIDIDLSFGAKIGELDFPTLEGAAKAAAGELLRQVSLVDLYDGDGGESITLRFSFSSPERTLSKAELQGSIDAITACFAGYGAALKTF